MTYSPADKPVNFKDLITLGFSPWAPMGLDAAIGSGSVLVQNQAYYIPIEVHEPITIASVMWFNATTVNGSADVGLYDESFNRLFSTGSVTQTGTSTLQVVDVTDYYVRPNRYYMAIASNSATGTYHGVTYGADFAKVTGILIQSSAFNLPATATPAAWTTDAHIPTLGIRQP